jgi:hypothetical protein
MGGIDSIKLLKNKHFQMFAERVRACELLKAPPFRCGRACALKRNEFFQEVKANKDLPLNFMLD